MKKNFFKLTIIFISLMFIYKYFVNNESVYYIISNFNYSKLFFLILAITFIIFLYAKLLLIILTNLCGINIPNTKWYLIYFNSQFLNSIPLFGIFYRAIQLKKFHLSYDKFFGIYIMTNWFFIFLSLFLFSIESYFIFSNIKILGFDLHFFIFILSFLFFIVPIFILLVLKFLTHKIKPKIKYFSTRVEKLINLFFNSISNKYFLKKFLFIFLLIHFLEFVVLILLISAFNQEISFQNSFIIFMGNILIDTFNILPQNLIISEIGLGLLTDKMNFNFELGVLIKIYFRFLLFFASVLIAILYNVLNLLVLKKNMK